MILEKIINEISESAGQANHRSAQNIYNLLEKNRRLFISKMEEPEFNNILRNFEKLADYHPSQYSSDQFKDEYNRAYNLLRYYVERII